MSSAAEVKYLANRAAELHADVLRLRDLCRIDPNRASLKDELRRAMASRQAVRNSLRKVRADRVMRSR